MKSSTVLTLATIGLAGMVLFLSFRTSHALKSAQRSEVIVLPAVGFAELQVKQWDEGFTAGRHAMMQATEYAHTNWADTNAPHTSWLMIVSNRAMNPYYPNLRQLTNK